MKKILPIALLTGIAAGQVAGDLRYIQSEDKGASYPQVYAFYNPTQNVKGFTFMEFYAGRYFGKTTLDKGVGKNIGVKAEVTHANEPLTRMGVGPSYVFPQIHKDFFAKVDILPVFVNKNGKQIKNRVAPGYFASLQLPKGIEASSFGQWINNGKKTNWSYGEFELKKNFGKNHIGYNAALLGKGEFLPRVQHRVGVGRKF